MQSVDNVSQSLGTFVAKAIGASIPCCKTGTDAVSLGLAAATAGLRAMAVFTMKNQGKDNYPTHENMVFAVAIALCCVEIHGERHDVEIGPSTVTDAINMTEMLTGKKVDDFINPHLLAFAKEPMRLDPEQAIKLAQFLPPNAVQH